MSQETRYDRKRLIQNTFERFSDQDKGSRGISKSDHFRLWLTVACVDFYGFVVWSKSDNPAQVEKARVRTCA